MIGKFRKHWRGIVIGVLCFALVLLGDHYFDLAEKYEVLNNDYDWARESLERSVKELAETRKKLVSRDFESYEELEVWVARWEIENKPVFLEFLGMSLAIGGNEDAFGRYKDCDDVAEAMQRDAFLDGYRMSVALVDAHGVYYGVNIGYANHAGNLAVAGGAYYYIEPQTGEIVFIIQRD